MKNSSAKKKKLIFIAQSKGGCGKSVLAYLLGVKYKDALIVDMDDATKTTSTQMAWMKPMMATFLASTKAIDRSKFNKFMNFVSGMEQDMAISDLGASISEQLPNYVNDIKEMLPDILEHLNIELTILTVVGGANIFKPTMEYVDVINNSLNGMAKVIIMKNEYFEFTDKQNKELEEYAKDKNLAIIPYTITPDTSEEVQQTIKTVMEKGEGPFIQDYITMSYFVYSAKKINVYA